MRIYITEAQIPELTDLNPEMRRFLRRCALQRLRAQHPLLARSPGILCALGVIVGFQAATIVLTLPQFPKEAILEMYLGCGVISGCGWIFSLVGSQIVTHMIRPHLCYLLNLDYETKPSA